MRWICEESCVDRSESAIGQCVGDTSIEKSMGLFFELQYTLI